MKSLIKAEVRQEPKAPKSPEPEREPENVNQMASQISFPLVANNKDQLKALEIKVYIYYLDCGDGFMGFYLCQNLQVITLSACSLLCVNYTSI